MLTLEFKPQDLWVGVYLKPQPYQDQLDIWLCLLPMFPLHFRMRYRVEACYLTHQFLSLFAVFSGGYIYNGYWFIPSCSHAHLHWVLLAYGLAQYTEEVDAIPF